MSKHKYTNEFKLEAAKLVVEQGYTHIAAAKALDVNVKNLSRWVGMISVTVRATFSDILTPEKLVKLGVIIGSMFALGPIFGPFLGGYLQFYFGWQSCFLFFSVVVGVLLVAVLIYSNNQYGVFDLDDYTFRVAGLQETPRQRLMGIMKGSKEKNHSASNQFTVAMLLLTLLILKMNKNGSRDRSV